MIRSILARRWYVSLLAVLVSLCLTSGGAAAQQVGETRAGVAGRDTVSGPPITPRRAFISSLLVPGSAQAELERPLAGALFVALEAVSIAMVRKSMAALRAARRTGTDSIIVGYQPGPLGGQIPIRAPNPFAGELIDSRRQQVEDWVALLVFNHFFAGAEAFVAAHLWEVPARVGARVDGASRAVGLSIAW